jgi:hypothetical protein
MIESSIQVRFKDNPVLLDKILQDMQTVLMDKLAWLNFAFGRAYKMVENRPDGNKFIYPAYGYIKYCLSISCIPSPLYT